MEQIEKEEIKAIMKEFSDKTDERFKEFSDKTDERFKEFSDKTDERFDEILTVMNEHANRMDERFEGIDERFVGIDNKLDSLDQRVGHLENQMVTKDYLDRKLSDLRGDFVGAIRREDEKVNTLVGKLNNESALSDFAAQEVLKMKPLVNRQEVIK